ncbi:methyltransferase domain-containing protein [Cryptosporangium sp. NPDC051539]|uniref:methyltransferase domain-containing protein n=1 Tax=Cryptosporangium sp. NPDC051539 TaxID=3363962 RepID=UPI0037BBD75B
MTATTAARLYAEGIRALAAGRRPSLLVRTEDGSTTPLGLDDWYATECPGDRGLLDRCGGPTLDAGCGPGRLAAALAARGRPVLAVDIVPAAVASARRRGAVALRRSLYARLPGEGRWPVVLLADGNVGIGGDPGRVLRRTAEVIGAGGRVLVEWAAPGRSRRGRIRLESGDRHSEWFPWAEVGADAAARVAALAGLHTADTWEESGRWFAVLTHG